jgi:hypothetical protein
MRTASILGEFGAQLLRACFGFAEGGVHGCRRRFDLLEVLQRGDRLSQAGDVSVVEPRVATESPPKGHFDEGTRVE